jgi:hydrogenase/urease accessory protein HupE
MSRAIPAQAHDPALSSIKIIFQNNNIVISVMTHLSRLAKAESLNAHLVSEQELDRAIRKRLRIKLNDQKIIYGEAHNIEDKPNDLLTWQTITNQRAHTWEVMSPLYPEDPTSLTTVSILRDGQSVQEAVIDASLPDVASGQIADRRQKAAARYFSEGVKHILTGADHILFLLGLLLLGGSITFLLRTITTFTVAHSITLSLAATGIVTPAAKIVEPLIALSIVAIAIENLRQLRKTQSLEALRQDYRPYYAFAFGLIHGFGFAGALAEIGIPKDSLWLALGSFNIGVECGQAIIVLTVAPLLSRLAMRKPHLLRKLVFGCSLCIGIAGAYWFVTRMSGA